MTTAVTGHLGRAMWNARYGGGTVFALVIVVLPLVLPNNFYFDVVINIGLAAIVCVGLNLLIGYTGQISLGHAGFFALGAYASAILSGQHGWPPLLAMLAGMAGVGVLALILARPILRLKGHYLAMATLGMGAIISIILNQEVALTGGPDGTIVPPLSLFGWTVQSEFSWYCIVAGVLLVEVWLAFNLIQSPIGRALRSIHGSEAAASATGVDVTRYKQLVFVLSAVFASLAGSLFAHHAQFLTPAEASFFKSIEFVTMVVFGGMASIYGSILGAAILGALPQFLTVLHDYEHMAFGLILMLTMIFMPQGLLPSLSRRLGLPNR